MNYVAGLGRGATGFTTRSDIGPARMSSQQEAQGNSAPAAAVVAPPKKPSENLSESNFDAFGGYQDNLFADMPYDDDDEAADRVWEEIDVAMDERRRRTSREAGGRAAVEVPRGPSEAAAPVHGPEARPWAGERRRMGEPPRAGRTSQGRAAAKRDEKFSAAPDTLLDRARMETETHTSLEARQQETGGLETPMSGGATPLTDLKSIGEARGAVLSVKLDQMSDSVSGQTVVDPKGYLTDLNSIKVSTEAEIGDIKKARLLLKSVTQTNPGHGPGWIAAARLEEVAGKLVSARQVIRDGTLACPMNEDVWLEAARLQTAENAKVVLADAVKKIPQSVKIWLQARTRRPAARPHAALTHARLSLTRACSGAHPMYSGSVARNQPHDAASRAAQSPRGHPEFRQAVAGRAAELRARGPNSWP